MLLFEASGAPTNDPEKMKSTCRDFYSNLYSQAILEVTQERETEEFPATISPIVSDRMNEALCRDIILPELHNALKELSNGKAPDLDGVLTEFFKSF